MAHLVDVRVLRIEFDGLGEIGDRRLQIAHLLVDGSPPDVPLGIFRVEVDCAGMVRQGFGEVALFPIGHPPAAIGIGRRILQLDGVAEIGDGLVEFTHDEIDVSPPAIGRDHVGAST